MNQFNPESRNNHTEGGMMPTKVKNWTDGDEITAKELLARAETYDHKYTKGIRLTKAAFSLGYTGGYRDDRALAGVRAFISSINKNKKEPILTATTTASDDAANKKFVKALEKSWKEEFKNNPDFRRANTIPD